MDVVLRSDVPPLSLARAVERAVHDLDPNLPVSKVRTVRQLIADSISQPRFYVLLLGSFAVLALVLAIVGIFGVMSYAVTQQTREIGIRIALGADRAAVVGMVLGHAMLLAGTGLVIGLATALALARTMSTMLFELSPTDPLTFGAVTVLLGVVALLSSYLPARRATRVDPVVALRAE
jgi:putative ABC transport system permease protein